MSNSESPDTYTNPLGLIHELQIPLGDGVNLIYNASSLGGSEWWIEFPGEHHQPGVGCSAEDAKMLLMAANGPNTTIGYSTSHRSDADVARILAERRAALDEADRDGSAGLRFASVRTEIRRRE